MICENLGINHMGNLTLAGRDTVELAKKYQTPLFLMDEERIRKNYRTYIGAMKKYFGDDALPLYASKAASFRAIYKIAMEEGMGIDVVSCGEIYTAKSANFPMEEVYFHGNNKTDFDIKYAMENGIGYFVADSREEIDAIDGISGEMNLCQNIIIRITPGIGGYRLRGRRRLW